MGTAPIVSALSTLEQEIIDETNKIRQNPQSYVPILESYKERFQGNVVDNIDTQEGVAAVDEAIAFLNSTSPVNYSYNSFPYYEVQMLMIKPL